MPIYTKNKQAYFDYEILETIEAGLVLTGPEVKSIRTGHIKLNGSFVTIHGDQVMLTNAHISPYRFAPHDTTYSPTKSRVLLMHKKQRDHLRGKLQEAGLTAVPLSVYSKGRYLKIEIGIARGKKKYDKRETIKKREVKREVQRGVKRNYT